MLTTVEGIYEHGQVHLLEPLSGVEWARVVVTVLPASRHPPLEEAPRTANDAGFPVTDFESPDAPSVYQGRPLTLQQMREAIDWEAGQHQ
jgi:hypothetical protein